MAGERTTAVPEQKEIAISVAGDEITLHQDGELEPIDDLAPHLEAPRLNEIVVRVENVSTLIEALQDTVKRAGERRNG